MFQQDWSILTSMIRVTRLNSSPLILNSDLIEHIEITPDTVITLTTGQSMRVRESADDLIARIVEFRRSIYAPGGLPTQLSKSA
jgi:flagellar protein FlbD